MTDKYLGRTSFNKGNCANFFHEKEYNGAFWGAFFYENICEKNFMSKFILVVILILESKGLYLLKRTQHQAKKNYMYFYQVG